MVGSASVNGGVGFRPSRQQLSGPWESDVWKRSAEAHGSSGSSKGTLKGGLSGGKATLAIVGACFMLAGGVFLVPTGLRGADERNMSADKGHPLLQRTQQDGTPQSVDGVGHVKEDGSVPGEGGRRNSGTLPVRKVEGGTSARWRRSAGKAARGVIEPEHEVAVPLADEEGKGEGIDNVEAQEGDGGENQDGGEEQRRPVGKPAVGTVRGDWKWSGTVWKHVSGNIDKWWERPAVQDRLPFEKYINCKKPKEKPERPLLEGLPLHMKWEINDYLIHQGNFAKLQKGRGQPASKRIRYPKLLPPDGESVLKAHPLQWGTCAVVGNSGVLRLTEMARAIDSHDTVFRINQAPTYGYSRRVGQKTTHRVLNRQWTRDYCAKDSVVNGTKLPMERDLTFVLARATSEEYNNLMDFLSKNRPDVRLWYLSSRATLGAGPLLSGYRERLCHAGFGPYMGLNMVTSGLVSIIMLLPLCDRVTVYGFGVEGMATKMANLSPDAFGYHYYKGLGKRHVGANVHCFDCEEKVLQQMGAEGAIDFCTYDPNNATNSWLCGCRHKDVEHCRPPPRPQWLRDSDDCEPEYGDCEEVKVEGLEGMTTR